MKIKVEKADRGIVLPEYQTSGAAGADVRAFLKSPVTIKPCSASLIPTGIFAEVPAGYELQVRSRSGLALKNGIIVLNSPGTIDSDYRGEIKVILYNTSDRDFTVENGFRIAQLVLNKVEKMEFSLEKISQTARSAGGFGSTEV